MAQETQSSYRSKSSCIRKHFAKYYNTQVPKETGTHETHWITM